MEERLMACVKCRRALAIKVDSKMNTCPICGSKLVDMAFPIEKWKLFSKDERDRIFDMLAGANNNPEVTFGEKREKNAGYARPVQYKWAIYAAVLLMVVIGVIIGTSVMKPMRVSERQIRKDITEMELHHAFDEYGYKLKQIEFDTRQTSVEDGTDVMEGDFWMEKAGNTKRGHFRLFYFLSGKKWYLKENYVFVTLDSEEVKAHGIEKDEEFLAEHSSFSSIEEINNASKEPYPLYILKKDGRFYPLRKYYDGLEELESVRDDVVFIDKMTAFDDTSAINVLHFDEGDQLVTISRKDTPILRQITAIDKYISPVVFRRYGSYISDGFAGYRNYEGGGHDGNFTLSEFNGKDVLTSGDGVLSDIERYISIEGMQLKYIDMTFDGDYAVVCGDREDQTFSFGYYNDVDFVTEESNMTYMLMHCENVYLNDTLQQTKDGYFVLDLETFLNKQYPVAANNYFLIKEEYDEGDYVILCEDISMKSYEDGTDPGYNYVEKRHESSTDDTYERFVAVYEPVDSNLDYDNLCEIKDVLDKRIKYFALNATVSVEDNKLLVESPGITDVHEALARVTDIGGIKIITEYNSSGLLNYELDSSFTYNMKRDFQDMYDDGSILLDERNIEDIQIIKDDGMYRLLLKIDSEASSNMYNYAVSGLSSANTLHAAICISDAVSYDVIIQSASNNDTIVVGYYSSREEAEYAQMLLQSEVLPCGLNEVDAFVK